MSIKISGRALIDGERIVNCEFSRSQLLEASSILDCGIDIGFNADWYDAWWRNFKQ